MLHYIKDSMLKSCTQKGLKVEEDCLALKNVY